MTPGAVMFVTFCCAVLAAFWLGYAVGIAEGRAEWREKRRTLLQRLSGVDCELCEDDEALTRNPW